MHKEIKKWNAGEVLNILQQNHIKLKYILDIHVSREPLPHNETAHLYSAGFENALNSQILNSHCYAMRFIVKMFSLHMSKHEFILLKHLST